MARLVGEHLDGLLRMQESFQAAFAQRIETDHLGTALQRLAQRFEHARVVGAGVLAKYEDRIGVVEIFQRYRALTDTDGFGEGAAASWHMFEQSGKLLVPKLRPNSW